MSYQQSQFDQELQKMLQQAKARGHSSLQVLSKDLHDRVVEEDLGNLHRMPMACKAMWNLWEKQGSRQNKVIHKTPSGESSTIKIALDTD